MKKRWLYCLLSLFFVACQSETMPDVEMDTPLAEALTNFPVLEEATDHKVLTLGVFHFDRSMDGSDVVANNHMDILSTQNQLELDSLLTVLKQFSPSRIAVEWKPKYQGYLDSLYTAYRKGNYELGRNEAFQIGFRLAELLDLEGVYCIDNNPPLPEYINAIDDWDAYADELGHRDLWYAYDEANKEYNTYMDTMQNRLYLLDYLQLMNAEQNLKRTKQLWTTGLVNVGYGEQYLGADLLGRWYRRNVRLFAHAKNLVEADDENLLIVYGGAHKWVLDELFDSSPEFEVVQLNELIE